MRNKVLFAASTATLLAGTAVCHADTLAGGPLTPGAGAPAQTVATCALFNAGRTAVPLSSATIVTLTGLTASTFKNTCGASINAGQGCVIQATVTSSSSYTCVTSTTGSDAFVRGSLAIGTLATPSMVAVPLQATAGSAGS